MIENNNNPIRIEDLYPGHTEEWYARAEQNLQRYAEIIWRIYQRVNGEGDSSPSDN